jgi:F-type H+-transporting ATPase subunit epsilon
MERRFLFELLTPTATLVRERAREIIAPGFDGYFGVLYGHIYFATTLKKGKLSVFLGNRVQSYDVDGGFIQVTPESVTACVEGARLCEIKEV